MHDLIVIGGGINGCGIANDAAGRGLKVLLCEKNDLASSTSSNSTKLIHGGLRYLEHYKFKFVKEALAEREVLLRNAPHIIWPLRFILPHKPHLRPRWMILAGLFLYDHLTKRTTLQKSCGVTFNANSPLVNDMTKGFEYSDGWVDDARLVVLNAMSAEKNGATILTHSDCIKAIRKKDYWEVHLKNSATKEVTIETSKMLVNAAGPWVGDLFKTVIDVKAPQNVRLVKGSHIVVPKIYDHEKAYILQNEDNRIVFIIPYEGEFSLIGTTDVEVKQDPSTVHISDEEIDYLIEITNKNFKQKIARSDIVHVYSGVRPLLDDESSSAQTITRDYTLEIDKANNGAPLLSVFGGKITTYRKLAEAATNKISEFFPNTGPSWTKNIALPGGDFENKETLREQLYSRYDWLEQHTLDRYIRSYGTLTHKVLLGCCSKSDMGQHLGADLYQCEVDYLIDNEWATCVDDILWRRSKLGLKMTPSEQHCLSKAIKNSTDINSAYLQQEHIL